MKSSIKRVFKQFLSTTTLHGFKYLDSPYLVDRVGWVMWCCASACCAGVLCAVLWARFLQVPALLTLVSTEGNATRAPYVAICLSAERLAQLFEQALTLPKNNSVYLPTLFTQMMRNKPVDGDNLEFLERVLPAKYLGLSAALAEVTPPCGELIVKCRWLLKEESCEQLFRKAVTMTGVCCVAFPELLKFKSSARAAHLRTRLDLVLNCSGEGIANGCEYFTKYAGEDWVIPTALTTGYFYLAQLSSQEVLDSNQDKLVDSQCVSDPVYSMRKCIVACKERECGCSDPMRFTQDIGPGALPRCPLSRINCLRSFSRVEECGCRQACKKILTSTVLQNGRLDQIHNTFDPIFVGVNESVHTVLFVRVTTTGSKVFDLWYPDTWWSLLSSLGGVFNMFLGVGLCSALELLSLLLHRLPLALRTNHTATNRLRRMTSTVGYGSHPRFTH